MLSTAISLVFAPLAGALVSGLLGRSDRGQGRHGRVHPRHGRRRHLRAAGVLAADRQGAEPGVLDLGNWIESGRFHVDWALRYDTLSAVMVAMVSFVSMLIHVYSIGYMGHETRPKYRFFAYLSLFTFAMLMLVTADNLAQLFFGWEGVGLCSYLLIGYWYDRPSRLRRRDQGVRRQPHRRPAVRRRARADLLQVRLAGVRHDLPGRRRSTAPTPTRCSAPPSRRSR